MEIQENRLEFLLAHFSRKQSLKEMTILRPNDQIFVIGSQ